MYESCLKESSTILTNCTLFIYLFENIPDSLDAENNILNLFARSRRSLRHQKSNSGYRRQRISKRKKKVRECKVARLLILISFPRETEVIHNSSFTHTYV